MTEGNGNKKFCLLFCFSCFISASLLAVLIKVSECVARALLLLHWLLCRLLLLYWLLRLPLLPLDLRTWRGRRERPVLLHYRHGQSRLLGDHLVKEADARGVLHRVALVFAVHDVTPTPLVIHQLAADRICPQDGVEGIERDLVLVVRHSVWLLVYCQLALLLESSCCCLLFRDTEHLGPRTLQFYINDRRKRQQKKFCLLFCFFCIFVSFSSCSLLNRRLRHARVDDLLELVIATRPDTKALV